ncbi:MAG: asparagine synthase (glutamine-hydrolyzing) [Vicinamibacterales bacterium]
MCGIAGALFPSSMASGRDILAVVQRMTTALVHRGPDGRGVKQVAGLDRAQDRCQVALGHTRLAIIDLSERGAQPMSSADGSIWITFNGEIYNYREVRADLERRGAAFHSDSDTEVILRGYEVWGEEVVSRLDGMFAFALWDRRQQCLRLVRDRLGIKPLYVSHHAGVLFASEVRALLASGVVPRRLDGAAVDQYLRYQTVPSPRTLVAGVEMLPPGAIVRLDASGRATRRTYWDLFGTAAVAARQQSRTEARKSVGDLLLRSARSHMVSDVPVGLFLSGGIDSSALVSLVRRTGVTPRTFTVAFPGTVYDEAPFARAVAESFETEHTEVVLSEAQAQEHIVSAMATVDHPSGDGVNASVVSGAVRAAGIKVALSGLGGDEFFGGYPSFRRLSQLAGYRRAWRHTPRVLRRAASRTMRALGPDTVATSKAAALLESDGTLAQAYPVLRELFSRERRAALLSPEAWAAATRVEDPYEALLESAMAGEAAAGTMSRVSYAEARTYMHDVLLRDTDQMSMRHGLEVRVPLLDHRLVEHLMGLPDAAKDFGAIPKGLLIDSLGEPLPAVCTNRPKRGFVLPFDLWMRTALGPFCAHHLGPDGLGGRSFMRRDAVSNLWSGFLQGSGTTTWARPWALVALSAWLESTGVDL